MMEENDDGDVFPLDYVEYQRAEELYRAFAGRIEAVGVSKSQKINARWAKKPENIFIYRKPNATKIDKATFDCVKYLLSQKFRVFMEIPEYTKFLAFCDTNKTPYCSSLSLKKPPADFPYFLNASIPPSDTSNSQDYVVSADLNDIGHLEWIVVRDPLNDFSVSFSGSLTAGSSSNSVPLLTADTLADISPGSSSENNLNRIEPYIVSTSFRPPLREKPKNWSRKTEFNPKFSLADIDCLIVIGGDGTFLRATGLFTSNCPPILPFSGGTMGFLTPFTINPYSMIKILREIFEDNNPFSSKYTGSSVSGSPLARHQYPPEPASSPITSNTPLPLALQRGQDGLSPQVGTFSLMKRNRLICRVVDTNEQIESYNRYKEERAKEEALLPKPSLHCSSSPLHTGAGAEEDSAESESSDVSAEDAQGRELDLDEIEKKREERRLTRRGNHKDHKGKERDKHGQITFSPTSSVGAGTGAGAGAGGAGSGLSSPDGSLTPYTPPPIINPTTHPWSPARRTASSVSLSAPSHSSSPSCSYTSTSFSPVSNRGMSPGLNGATPHHYNNPVLFECQVLNEISATGIVSALNTMQLCIDGSYTTLIQACGVIIASATGSSAFSASSGGSIVHPSVPAMLVTPVCPHSLSFRPMVIPDSSYIAIRVPPEVAKAPVVNFDGRGMFMLKKGYVVLVTRSPNPVITFCARSPVADWVTSLDKCLNFNQRTLPQNMPALPPLPLPSFPIADFRTGPAEEDDLTQSGVENRLLRRTVSFVVRGVSPLLLDPKKG